MKTMEILNFPTRTHRGYTNNVACGFCLRAFSTVAEKNAHIVSHFEQEICLKCDQNLLRIGDILYVVHGTLTCIEKSIKIETPDEEQQEKNDEQIFLQQYIEPVDENQIPKTEEEAIELIDCNQRTVHSNIEHEDIEDFNPLDDAQESISVVENIKFETFDENQARTIDNSDVQQNVDKSSDETKKIETAYMNLNNNSSKSFLCEHCSKTFSSKTNRDVHVVRVHCPQNKKYNCNGCRLTFATRGEMYRHNKIRRKMCDVCGETFCNIVMLEFHREKSCPGAKVEKHEIYIEDGIITEPQNSTVETGIGTKLDKIDKNESEAAVKTGEGTHVKLFKCRRCEMSFSRKYALIRHNKIVPKICQFCNQTFCALSMLRYHQAAHCSPGNEAVNKTNSKSVSQSEENTENPSNAVEVSEVGRKKRIKKRKVHQCEICSKVYTKKFRLRYHFLRIHMPSLRKHKCDECEKYFIAQYALNSHYNTFICNKCGASFCAQSLYQAHTKGCNFKTRQKCKHNECNEIVSPNEWTSHLTSKHYDIYKAFMCDICKKTYSKKKSIRVHILSSHCSTIRKFKCDVCNYSCISTSILNKHKNMIHSNEHNFICPECGKSFKQKSYYLIHMNIHTGDKPFECPFDGCSKRFTAQPQRNEHIRMHTGEKPFECPVEQCGQRFTYSVSLRRHKFSAHGIYTKKHPCPICEKIFPETLLLKKHMKNHENQM